jgi:uridine kinase
VPTDTRGEVIRQIADAIERLQVDGPKRVAIDGLSATGKTTLANDIGVELSTRGCPVLRASLDDFKRPWSESHLYDRVSGDGYYRNAYDYDLIRSELLEPLEPCGDRQVLTHARDPLTGIRLPDAVQAAVESTILVVDGVFALRPELQRYWHLTVFLTMPFPVVLRRGADRDQAWEPTWECAAELYRTRYIPSEQIYLAEVDPIALADFVFEMTDPAFPEQL